MKKLLAVTVLTLATVLTVTGCTQMSKQEATKTSVQPLPKVQTQTDKTAPKVQTVSNSLPTRKELLDKYTDHNYHTVYSKIFLFDKTE